MKLIDIIKYEGDNKTLIWKHPIEDFNTGTQLIVHQSQEAIFFNNGEALDSFGPGKHLLNTQNVPFLSALINIRTGNKTVFHCEIYFVNRVILKAMKWGTSSKIEYLDPIYQLPVQIGASGEFEFSIENSRKLLISHLGTEKVLNDMDIIEMTRSFINIKLKTYIPKFIKNKKINIIDIDVNLEFLSQKLKQILQNDFKERGLYLHNFYITRVVKPENDVYYDKLKKLHAREVLLLDKKLMNELVYEEKFMESELELLLSRTKQKTREIEGYTYQEEQDYDVRRKMASNKGIGEYSNLGIGLGLMSHLSNETNSLFKRNSEKSIDENHYLNKCVNCEYMLSYDIKFCPNCGKKIDIREDINEKK